MLSAFQLRLVSAEIGEQQGSSEPWSMVHSQWTADGSVRSMVRISMSLILRTLSLLENPCRVQKGTGCKAK